MVDKSQEERDDGKVEDVPPVAVFRLLCELVIGSHGASHDEVGSDDAPKNHKDVLGDELPWRMAGSEEDGLQKPHLVSMMARVTGRWCLTYMVLQNLWHGKTILG